MIDPDLEARMQATAEAYRNNKPGAYFDAFADDATILIGGRGRASKQIYRAIWERVTGAGGGVTTYAVEDEQRRVSTSGEAVVVTFRMLVGYRGMVPGMPDQETDHRFSVTEVWFRTEDGWKIAHMDWFDAPDA